MKVMISHWVRMIKLVGSVKQTDGRVHVELLLLLHTLKILNLATLAFVHSLFGD